MDNILENIYIMNMPAFWLATLLCKILLKFPNSRPNTNLLIRKWNTQIDYPLSIYAIAWSPGRMSSSVWLAHRSPEEVV